MREVKQRRKLQGVFSSQHTDKLDGTADFRGKKEPNVSYVYIHIYI